MGDPVSDNTQRDRKIAGNERARQAASAFRISTFAIVLTTLIALAAFGWIVARH